MKKTLLSFLFILGLYPAIAQLPSTCDVPDELRRNYDRDVKNLALQWLYTIKSPDTALIDIPQWRQDTILHGLAAIYNRHDQSDVDSVFNKYCLHNATGPIWGQLLVYVDTSYAWTKNWSRLQTMTGIAKLDTLLARYGFTVWAFDQEHHHALLSTAQSVNEFAYCDSLKTFPGITDAWSNGLGGAGVVSFISFSDTSNRKYYTFCLGWGLSNTHVWRYRVNPGCSVEFLGNETNMWQHDSLPQPPNCNILGAPPVDVPGYKVEIYPNPATRFATISVGSPDGFSYRIINCFGNTVRSGNGIETCSVNVSDIGPGLYLVQVEKSDSRNRIIKLIIE